MYLHHVQKTTDGLEVAEYDLRRRGPGDLLGAKQSGYKAFRLANLQVRPNLWHAPCFSRLVEQLLAGILMKSL